MSEGLNYTRRQQYRRLSNASTAAGGSAVASLLGLVIAGAGAPTAAAVLLLAAVALGLYARHWLSLARRSSVGARSEDEVRRVRALVQAEGWRLRHSLRWRGRGDIDSVAIADWRRVRDRDQDEGVRAPSRPGARAGGVAVAPASAVVSARGGAGGLRGSPTWRPAA